jgi:Flp pilus assembly protein TadG
VLELMLVLPILIMLSFGAVDYGYAMYLKNTVQGAALLGARSGIVSGSTNTAVTTAISSYMTAAGLGNSGYTVTLSPTDVSTVSSGGTVTVQVSVTWGKAGTHALGNTWGGISDSKTISGSGTMMHE